MSDFSKQPVDVINATNMEQNGNEITITDESGKEITFTLTPEALSQLPEVLSSVPTTQTTGGSRRRKSRKHKVVKRINKSRSSHRR